MCNLCSNLSQFQFTLDREHPWTLHLLLPGNMTNSIVSNPVRARNDIDYHETRFAPSPPITGMIQVRLRHYQSSPGRTVTLTIQLKQPEENTICFVHEGGQMIIKRLSYPQRMDKPLPPTHIVQSFKMALSDHLYLISRSLFACTVKKHSAGSDLYTWMLV